MIGYDPDGLMIYLARKQEVGDILLSCGNDAEREEVEAKLVELSKAVVLEKTGIEIGSKAVVCLTGGISLVGGIRPLHDHDDPNQHITVEVTKINCWGDIFYNNPTGEEQSTHMGMITLCED
jgi:hypothetical protein